MRANLMVLALRRCKSEFIETDQHGRGAVRPAQKIARRTKKQPNLDVIV